MVENREEEILKLLKENNLILHKIIRRQHWQTFFHIMYWLIIGGIAIAGYHFLQPYVAQLFDTYSTVQDGINKITF